MSNSINILETVEFKAFKQTQLNLLIEITRLFDRWGIKYYAGFGTMLGIIRHQGFIPWDDDIDLIIWQEDLEKLKECIHQDNLTNRFIFDDEPNFNATDSVIRFLDPNTTYFSSNTSSLLGKYGIFIDISVLYFTFNDASKREKKYFRLKKLFDLLAYKKEGRLNNTNLEIINEANALSIDTILKRVNECITQCDTKKLCEAYDYDHHFLFESKWFGNEIEWMKFENILLPVPIHWREILSSLYGKDFLCLPPKDEQFPHHIIGSYFCQKPYQMMLDRITNFWKIPEDAVFIIWGSGNMFQYFTSLFEKYRMPDFIVDSNPKKWGNKINNCEIISPNYLKQIVSDKIHLVICNIYYQEIVEFINRSIPNIEPYFFFEGYVKNNEKLLVQLFESCNNND